MEFNEHKCKTIPIQAEICLDCKIVYVKVNGKWIESSELTGEKSKTESC